MEVGLASALFATHHCQEELLLLILPTAFFLSGTTPIQNIAKKWLMMCAVIYCIEMWLQHETQSAKTSLQALEWMNDDLR